MAYFANSSQNHPKDGSCRKHVLGGLSNRAQTPGVCLFCCEHGVCERLSSITIVTNQADQNVYGFHIMVDPEGRKDVFYTLYERLPQTALDKLTVVNIKTQSALACLTQLLP